MAVETLIAELKRRRVFRVLVGYGLVAFAVLQVIEPIQHALGMSDAVLKLVVVLLAIGFPVAVVLAWAFDVGGGGIERTAPAATWNGTRLALVLVGIGVLAAAPGVVWVFFLRGAQARDQQQASGPQSIAVLPFVNMSGEKENEYFSDGISEEILNVLAQTPELRVAARTSSFSFKGQSKEVPAIARELEVRMVLEGSVRKQGERVRITAQLIDASTGFHVWSQTYDRELKDIFAIQDEIAHAIAQHLKVKLGGERETARAPADLAAWDLYLRGLELWQARGQANLDQAERLFRQALERDPKLARAWAGVALVEALRPDWFGAPMAEAYGLARDAAEHGLALDPSLPEAYAVLGTIAAQDGRVATSRALLDRALALAPSYATAWQWFGEVLAESGAIEEALEKGKRSVELDPRSPIVRYEYAAELFYAGRDAEGERICDGVIRDAPEFMPCLLFKFDALLARKDLPGARAHLTGLAAQRGPAAARFAGELIDVLEGKAAAPAVASRLLPMPDGFVDPKSPTPLADPDAILWFIAAGRKAEAIARLERVAHGLPHVARQVLVDRHSDPLRCEPQFKALAGRLGFADARAATVCAGR